jgi:hypothetical protein
VLPLLRASNSTRIINARKVRVNQGWRSEHLLTILPGKTVDHQFAKELLAGFVGGKVDKLVETHGMNEYDKYEAHKHAKKHAEQFYDQPSRSRTTKEDTIKDIRVAATATSHLRSF